MKTTGKCLTANKNITSERAAAKWLSYLIRQEACERALDKYRLRRESLWSYMAIVHNDYYFIEVNPTGEWGWLEIKTDQKISMAIKEELCGEDYEC